MAQGFSPFLHLPPSPLLFIIMSAGEANRKGSGEKSKDVLPHRFCDMIQEAGFGHIGAPFCSRLPPLNEPL